MKRIDYSGRTFDKRYRAISLLGRGGIGSVYLGQHTHIGRKLAIKILHEEFTHSEEMVTRFYREAQAAAAIGHKNIIDVLDVGATDEGNPFMIMEYLEGESVRQMLKRAGPIDIASACGVVEPALVALAAAHKAGVVHRDLKPDNIFLVYHEEDGTTVKLIDFGISKITLGDDQTQLTKSGALLGTPAYMSPEQATGEPDVDRRADIYSVGVILFEMLTGQLPFQADNYNALLAAILTKEPPRPSLLNAAMPAEAERVIMKAMERDPDARYGSAEELLAALQLLGGFEERRRSLEILASGVISPTYVAGDLGSEVSETESTNVAADMLDRIAAENTPSEWASTATRKKKRTLLVGGLAAAAVLAVLGGVLLFFREPNAEAPRPERAAQASPTNPATVQISLEGVPEGASVYYDNALVALNPFPARRGTAVVPLRVEMEGHGAFTTSVLPAKDMTIAVFLTALPEATPEPIEAPEPSSKPTIRARKPAKARSSDAQRGAPAKPLKKARRGAEYVESFE